MYINAIQFYEVGLSVKFVGVKFIATNSTTTTFDYKIPSERWLHGGIYKIFNYNDVSYGDQLNVKLIDIDNILGYGNNFQLFKFVDSEYVTSYAGEISMVSPAATLLKKDLYLRYEYVSTGAVDIKFISRLKFATY